MATNPEKFISESPRRNRLAPMGEIVSFAKVSFALGALVPLTGTFNILDRVRVGESGRSVHQEKVAAAKADRTEQRARGGLFTKVDQKYERGGKVSPRRK